jgi:hypothetical protein
MKLRAIALVVVATLLAPAFSVAEDAPKVIAHNYVRAESDYQFKTYVETYDCFGKFVHSRAPYDVNNQVTTKQSDKGTFAIPNWDKEEVDAMRATINVVAATVPDSSKMFGLKDELDPVYHMLGAALGWGGLPAKAATYLNMVPEENNGRTAYTLTVNDVPVDAFWSVTLYDNDGWMPVNKYNAYSFNNVTAKKNNDGSITIHFGGDPEADNFLPIVEGWNYIVRQYRPRKEILEGTWNFPAPVKVK